MNWFHSLSKQIVYFISYHIDFLIDLKVTSQKYWKLLLLKKVKARLKSFISHSKDIRVAKLLKNEYIIFQVE
jgi:hypothetical protein